MDVEALAEDVERIGLSDDDFSRENAEGWGKLVFAEGRSPTYTGRAESRRFTMAQPYVLISADCHAGPPAADYREYLERQHHAAFDEHLEARGSRRSAMGDAPLESFAEHLQMPEASLRAFATHPTLQPGGHPGLKDAKRRIADLDAEGIAGEVVFPDFTADNDPPFGVLGSGRKPGGDGMFGRSDGFYEPVLVRAGARAYNRWLVDFCAGEPERHAGIAVVPGLDVEGGVAETAWAHESGLRGGIMLPTTVRGQPTLNDPCYDPLWAKCQELGMPVNCHVGHDLPEYGPRPESFALSQTEMLFFAHRPLWWLMWGGVFERFPELRFVLTEQDAYWVPQTLRELETVYHSKFAGPGLRAMLSLSPTEYWERQCYVGATVMSRAEAEARDAIGLDNVLWGADYPHLESTWPYTTKCLRGSFAGLPQEDVVKIVGGNAARVYGFDLAALGKVAAQIGPTVEEVAVPLPDSDIPDDYIGEGLRRPVSHG